MTYRVSRYSLYLDASCIIRSHRFAGIYALPRVRLPWVSGGICCCEERFNVFTPPAAARRRVGPGMLIARGTIVGFYDDGMQFPGHVVSYIGNNFVLFQPTCIYARSMGLSSRAFTIRFLPTFDPSVTIGQCRRTSLKTARFVRRLGRRLTYLREAYDMLRAVRGITKEIMLLE